MKTTEASLNDVLLSALKLCYERATRVGYANAGLSTDELILIEKAIVAADPSYKAPALASKATLKLN